MFQKRVCGFTVVEIVTTLVLMSTFAIFVMPKLVRPREDRVASALVRETVTTIGQMYLTRKRDLSYPAEAIGTTEHINFARYLYDHLNYRAAIPPDNAGNTGPAQVDTYCTTPNPDYFVLTFDARIMSICDVPTTGSGEPDKLEITLRIPIKNNTATTEVVMVIPEGDERFTTRLGFARDYGLSTTGLCDNYIDPYLKVIDTSLCPSP